MSAYCGLHYKTTKVKDVLCFAASLLEYYDAVMGNEIVNQRGTQLKCGPALTHFLNALETRKEYKQQLYSFAEDTKSIILGNAARARMRSLDGKGCGKNLAKIANKSEVASRLIGLQANVVLEKPWVLNEIIFEAASKHKSKKKYFFVWTCQIQWSK